MTIKEICRWNRVQENIWVQDNAPEDFQARIQEDLAIIASKEIGARLISKIRAGTISVYISHGNQNLTARTSGKGSFDMYVTLSFKEKKVHVFGKEELSSCPSFIVLAHELIHAYHGCYGKGYPKRDCDTDRWGNSEEEYTIQGYSSGERAKPKITENNIRKEHGLPARFSHKLSLTPALLEEKRLSFSVEQV